MLYLTTIQLATVFALLCFHSWHWFKELENLMLPAPITAFNYY